MQQLPMSSAAQNSLIYTQRYKHPSSESGNFSTLQHHRWMEISCPESELNKALREVFWVSLP